MQAGFIHVICLGISNKSVAVPRQDSIHPYRAHAVLSGHCIYIQLIADQHCMLMHCFAPVLWVTLWYYYLHMKWDTLRREYVFVFVIGGRRKRGKVLAGLKLTRGGGRLLSASPHAASQVLKCTCKPIHKSSNMQVQC